MKIFMFAKIKKMFSQNSQSEDLLKKIQQLENQIEELKQNIDNTQSVRVEKIIVEKIFCEKVETSYKIESIITENLSGTMNVGTIFPKSESEHVLKKEKQSESPKIKEPMVNINYNFKKLN